MALHMYLNESTKSPDAVLSPAWTKYICKDVVLSGIFNFCEIKTRDIEYESFWGSQFSFFRWTNQQEKRKKKQQNPRKNENDGLAYVFECVNQKSRCYAITCSHQIHIQRRRSFKKPQFLWKKNSRHRVWKLLGNSIFLLLFSTNQQQQPLHFYKISTMNWRDVELHQNITKHLCLFFFLSTTLLLFQNYKLISTQYWKTQDFHRSETQMSKDFETSTCFLCFYIRHNSTLFVGSSHIGHFHFVWSRLTSIFTWWGYWKVQSNHVATKSSP